MSSQDLPALIADTPHNRAMLRRILFTYRHYFSEGCGYDPEAAAWAKEKHQMLMPKSKKRIQDA